MLEFDEMFFYKQVQKKHEEKKKIAKKKTKDWIKASCDFVEEKNKRKKDILEKIMDNKLEEAKKAEFDVYKVYREYNPPRHYTSGCDECNDEGYEGY